MHYHIELGNTVFTRSRTLSSLIKKREINLAGNKQLNIYGTLQCKSGSRMKTGNRVFFSSEAEAIEYGYRPCGNCMKDKYKQWRNGII